MNFPAMILADLHINKKNLTEISYLFEVEIPKRYGQYKCESIIFVGDIFHSVSVIDTEVYLTAYNLMEKLSAIIPDIYIVAGNHDMYLLDKKTPLVPTYPFNKFATIYTEPHKMIHKKTQMLEFVPWPYKPKVTTEGVTFVHGTMYDVAKYLHLEYIQESDMIHSLNPKRMYLAGHIHAPCNINNKIYSIGCPVPNRFVEGEFNNRIGILNDVPTWEYKSILNNISSYNILKIKSLADLTKEKVKIGEVATWVKLKLYTAEVTSQHIREFKKDTNWKVITTREYKIAQMDSKLTATEVTTPAQVYKEFLKKAAIPQFNKNKLWKLVKKCGI